MTQNQTRRLFAALVAIGIFAAAPSGAWADAKSDSLEHFSKGKTHYDLGRFDEAVAEFQKAYELHQDPVYLFNIAQAHRQKGDAVKAIFFYKRFLAADPQNPKRGSVEKRIKELEEIAKKQEENRQKPPEDVGKPGDTDRTPPEDTDKGKDDDKGKDEDKGELVALNDGGGNEEGTDEDSGRPDDTRIGTTFVRPRHWRLGVEAGPGFISIAGFSEPIPMQVSVRGGAAYTIPMGKLAVDLGVGATYTPIPYELAADSSSPVSNLIGLLANVAGRYHVGRHFDVRAEAGLGILWWSGLKEGNPFTDNSAAATGALPMFLLRLGLGVDYVLDNGLIISATPVTFSYSPPHKGLDDEFGGVTQFDLLVGLGYAL